MEDTSFHGFIVNLKKGRSIGFNLFEDDFLEFSGKCNALVSFLSVFRYTFVETKSRIFLDKFLEFLKVIFLPIATVLMYVVIYY